MKPIIFFILFIITLNISESKAANYLVTSNQDTGQATLRWAIGQANSNLGLDTIQFNISSSGGQIVISPLTELTPITDPLFIDGYSQPGNVDTNINLVLSGDSLGHNQSYGLIVNTGIFNVQGLHFKNFHNNTYYLGSGRMAILIHPNIIYTTRLEKINIEKNKFSFCLQAVKLYLDNYGIIDTLDGINISDNSFIRVTNAFQHEFPSHYTTVQRINAWKINRNFISDCMGSAIELDLKDVYPSVDTLFIEINNNIITALDTVNGYYIGIELLLPNAKKLLSGLKNISIGDNSFRGFHETINVECPRFSTINNNVAAKLDIHNNNITGLSTGFGINLSGSNSWICSINENYVDSCSKGLSVVDGSIIDSLLFQDLNINNNNFSHNGFGIYFYLGGTGNDYIDCNNFSISENIIEYNNGTGMRFNFGGTGDLKINIDSLIVKQNTITQNGEHGIELSLSGTGSCVLLISNIFINDNDIGHNASNGLSIYMSSASLFKSTIIGFNIEENRIYLNGKCGIDFYSSSGSSKTSIIDELNIIDNKINNNNNNGISFKTIGFCGLPTKFKNVKILKNTISYNKIEGIKIETYDGIAGTLFKFYESFNISQNSINLNSEKGIYHNHSPSLFKPAAPTITSASINNSITASCNLSGIANSTYVIDFYISDTIIVGAEQGKTWIGSDTITTNNQGLASKTSQFNINCPFNSFLSMTAREIQKGMTSEFSPYCLITSISSYEQKQFLLYPNPTNDVVYIQSEKVINSISIYNNIGELVITKNFNQNKVSLPVKDLPSGLYFITIKTESCDFTEKIMIHK